ncbi:MAG: hypothetical protein AAGK71_15080 [Pseudomonadota bacterium]
MLKTVRSFLLVSACAVGGPAFSQDAKLSLELNSASDVEGACRLSFLVQSGFGTDITSLVFETVVFTSDAQVERLTLFDFQSVPAGRPRVRQFDLSGTSCSGVGSILINGVETCNGDALTPDACQTALNLSTRTNIGVDG